MIIHGYTVLLNVCGQSAQARLFRNMFEGKDPTSWQVVLLGGVLLLVVVGLVAWELFRKRGQQLAKMRKQWEQFLVQARVAGLGDGDIALMKEMYHCLDALHAPDAMLRIPASYDRALDAWLTSKAKKFPLHNGSIWG